MKRAGDVGVDQHAHGAQDDSLAPSQPMAPRPPASSTAARLVVIAAERYAIANAAYMRQKHNESVIEIPRMPELRALAYDRQRLARVAQTALGFVKRFGYCRFASGQISFRSHAEAPAVDGARCHRETPRALPLIA